MEVTVFQAEMGRFESKMAWNVSGIFTIQALELYSAYVNCLIYKVMW